MPAAEIATVLKLGSYFGGSSLLAWVIDPTGIATGITLVGGAAVVVWDKFLKTNAGKTRTALKAEKAENVRLRAIIAEQSSATAELKAEIRRLNVVVDNWFKLWMEHEQNSGKPVPDPRTFDPAEPQ